MPKVNKSQLIELVSPGVAGGNGTTKIQFNDQPYLRGKAITAIEILTNADMTATPSNRTPITAAQMETAYLTLYLTDPSNPSAVGEWISLVPFTLLHRVQNATPDPFTRQMFELVGQTIYWEKCYVTLATGYGNTTDVSFLVQVYFK